jgi:hypothetical protein
MHVRRFGDGGVWLYLGAVGPVECFEAGIWSLLSIFTLIWSRLVLCIYRQCRYTLIGYLKVLVSRRFYARHYSHSTNIQHQRFLSRTTNTFITDKHPRPAKSSHPENHFTPAIFSTDRNHVRHIILGHTSQHTPTNPQPCFSPQPSLL